MQTWPRIEIYLRSDGWHWRRRSRNGRTIDASEEGLRNKSYMLSKLKKRFPRDPIVGAELTGAK